MRTITRLKVERFWQNAKGLVLFGVFVGILVAGGVVIYPTIRPAIPDNGDVVHHDNSQSTVVREFTGLMDSGRYDDLLARLPEVLKDNPRLEELHMLQAQLMNDLKIDFKFTYLPGRRGHITRREASPSMILTPKDPYYLMVHPSDRCYLYLFQHQSSGQLTQLFPTRSFGSGVNPVPAGQIRIPEGYDWFYLDSIPGVETIFLLASRWQQKDVETMAAKLASEQSIERKELIVNRVLSRLQLEEEAAEKIPGLVFARHQFTHKTSFR